MSDHGVGLNGEPDDFSARYDRMVQGRGSAVWVVRTIVVLVVTLVAVALVRSVIPF